MEEESLRFWIIPIIALIFGIAILGYFVEYKINTVIPNAILELDEIKKMSCEQIKARNGIGSYWTPQNGVFARDKVENCIDAEIAYKEKLQDIRRVGTHQEKLNAGFTKLWFGIYDHPELQQLTKMSIVKIPKGTVTDDTLYPSSITVISGYNDTIKFVNEDDVATWLSEDYGKFGFGLIKPNETASIQVSEAGVYHYYSKPWQVGILTVLESEKENEK